MKGKLSGFKVVSPEDLLRTENPEDAVSGEILWLNLSEYDQIIDTLDSYLKAPQSNFALQRFECEPTTDEPLYRGIKPTNIKCWSYKKL